MARSFPPPPFYPGARAGKRALVAVLAGGRGRRLNGAKACALLDGRPLISYPLEAAARAGLEAVVLAKRGSTLPALDCEVVWEPERPVHPLCGIVSALRYAGEVVAVGCDMPLLEPDLLAWLAQLDGAAVMEVGGWVQPLPGRYVAEQLPALERALAREAPLREAVRSLGPALVAEEQLQAFGDPQRLCFNVNDARGLAQAQRLLESAGAR